MNIKDNVIGMKEELEKLKKEHQNQSIAIDLLKELKNQNKRQHIIIFVLIFVIATMTIGFFIFTNQFEVVAEETIVDGGNGNATYLENSNSGDINYGKNN